MTRLFVTLYALILVAAFGFMFSINPILNAVLENTQSHYAKINFGGVFAMLDEQLSPTNNRKAQLLEIQSLFEYDVDLISMEEFSPTPKEMLSLQRHGAISRSVDAADIVYARSLVETEKIWSLQIDPSQSNINHDMAIGPVKLLEKKLRKFPQSEWKTQLKVIDDSFGIPLSLLDSSATEILSLEEKKQLDLGEGKVVGLNVDEENERYFYQFPETNQILKVGPIGVPAFVPYLLPMICAVIALLFASVIFLWMRPLWRNLSSLHAAAKTFGQGDFSARTHITKFSPIKPLSSNFNQMAARVQSLISSHKDLTNAVSHEIRTPLARMRFGLEMLETADNAKDKKRFANEMSADIEELDALVGELLTYARFERSKPNITLTEHTVIPWLKGQVSRAQKLNKDVVITLHHQGISENQTFYFEERLLARALSNLLRNALRYGRKQIQMSISQTDIDFSICVDDDGTGVPEKDRATLFDPFTRVDESRSRDTGGFGIGLAIVKQVADWHHAIVTVEDSSLGGARFVMRLPKNQN